MTLNEQQIKMLARIGSDSPMRGDGQEFMALLRTLEIDALEQGRALDDIRSRLMQGQSLGFEWLHKQFTAARKS
jgi:hypothetical protein